MGHLTLFRLTIPLDLADLQDAGAQLAAYASGYQSRDPQLGGERLLLGGAHHGNTRAVVTFEDSRACVSSLPGRAGLQDLAAASPVMVSPPGPWRPGAPLPRQADLSPRRGDHLFGWAYHDAALTAENARVGLQALLTGARSAEAGQHMNAMSCVGWCASAEPVSLVLFAGMPWSASALLEREDLLARAGLSSSTQPSTR